MRKPLQTREVIFFATSLSIILTMMTFLTPSYDKLWLSVEIISLPMIYALGYEHIIKKQKEGYERDIGSIIQKTSPLMSKLEKAENEIATLKKSRRFLK